MNEIYAIKKDTPHVRAIKVSDRIAKYPCEGMPQIYHKEFDLHEFIGEEIVELEGLIVFIIFQFYLKIWILF